MKHIIAVFFFFFLLFQFTTPSLSQSTTTSSSSSSCSQATFSQNRLYALCSNFPRLGASLHWTYHPSNATADIAYRAPQSPSGWVAWALNPSRPSSMLGSQALVAFPKSDGSLVVYTSAISTYTPAFTPNATLSYAVYSKEAEYGSGMMTIYARIGVSGNRTRVNQVWQAGTQFGSDGVPAAHPTTGDNVLSMGTLDLLSGEAAGVGGNSRQHRKNIHGVLNVVSWGILLPVGVIIARYLKVFKSANPAWFYLHVACQTSAYIVGVAGWGTGLKLGSESSGITYHRHRNIGITLFCLGTLQVFALLLRPNKGHKYRLYWNIYHQSVGYTVIILSVVNIFKGFNILKPEQGWKNAYIAIIATLGGIALLLEAVTWSIVLKRRSTSSDKSHNGANDTNGYNGRQQERV